MGRAPSVRAYRAADEAAWWAVYRSWALAVERSEELAFSQSGTTDAPIVRLVAEVDGRVVGTAVANGASPLPHGRWSVRILVDPGSRRQGVGRALADALDASLPARHPDLVTTVADDDPGSAAFAERRRFRPWQHSIASTLDLAATEPREPRVPAGVEVRVLAMDASDAVLREAYEVFLATTVGLPDLEGDEVVPEDVFRRLLANAGSTLVATAGGRPVGYVTAAASGSTWHVLHTGVAPSFRRQGVATGLKIALEGLARGSGATTLRVHNLSTNGAILAVNRRLGYRRGVGTLRLLRGAGVQSPLNSGGDS